MKVSRRPAANRPTSVVAGKAPGTAHVSVQLDAHMPSHMETIGPVVREAVLDVGPCAESVDATSPLLAFTNDEAMPDIEGIERIGTEAWLPAKMAHITAAASATAGTIALSGQLAVPEADDASTHRPYRLIRIEGIGGV